MVEAPAGAVAATDSKFSQATINATAGQAFTISLKNDGKSIHNISFYDKQGANCSTRPPKATPFERDSPEASASRPPRLAHSSSMRLPPR